MATVASRMMLMKNGIRGSFLGLSTKANTQMSLISNVGFFPQSFLYPHQVPVDQSSIDAIVSSARIADGFLNWRLGGLFGEMGVLEARGRRVVSDDEDDDDDYADDDDGEFDDKELKDFDRYLDDDDDDGGDYDYDDDDDMAENRKKFK